MPSGSISGKNPKKSGARKRNAAARRVYGIREAYNTSLDVRQRIATHSPITGIAASDLRDEMTLSGNLNYGSSNLTGLVISLNNYVKSRNSSGSVLPSEIKGTDAVKAVVKLIKTKVGEN